MKTITKRDLIERIADRLGMTRASVKRVVHMFLDDIVDELGAENRIEFRDFGVFEVKQRAARTAQNPKTLERVTVPPRLTVKFKPGRRMKELLEGEPGGDGGAGSISAPHPSRRGEAEIEVKTSSRIGSPADQTS